MHGLSSVVGGNAASAVFKWEVCSSLSTCECLIVPNTWEKFTFLTSALEIIAYQKMDSTNEIILFAKEMLRQKPSWSMLKIYMLGSTLAMIGMVGGVVEMILQPFLDNHSPGEEQAKFYIEMNKENSTSKSDSATVHAEVEDMMGAVSFGAKTKYLGTSIQRSSANRLHAS
ncbi:G0/G1 switch protein 2 isoform X2 [Nothobranchius furzeri]|uniref:G0/G1 switch protein 2 isoform X2 n=1 Tax=Nothobranchius furzeri TaxID=105023 RepID=UPI002403DCF7|nr:G0/G1 switch protein 2 isoform X2 [Nothobranchius furzeri]